MFWARFDKQRWCEVPEDSAVTVFEAAQWFAEQYIAELGVTFHVQILSMSSVVTFHVTCISRVSWQWHITQLSEILI